jgi:hypothetical protein
MAPYTVSFLCSDCGRVHATKISLTVSDGPDGMKPVQELYTPNRMPRAVTRLLQTYVLCPVTRNSLKLNKSELYLVPH